MSKIGWAQELTYNTSNTLSNSENIAKDIQAIPIPPVDAASGLASAINNTIVPEEQVMDVVTDANESEAKAMEALDTANNTRYKCNIVYSFHINNLTTTSLY